MTDSKRALLSFLIILVVLACFAAWIIPPCIAALKGGIP